MNMLRKSLMNLGGILLAAMLIAALAPKAVRAVAASLVLVANTTANPVPITSADLATSVPFQATMCDSFPTSSCTNIVRQFTVPQIASNGLPVKRAIFEGLSASCYEQNAPLEETIQFTDPAQTNLAKSGNSSLDASFQYWFPIVEYSPLNGAYVAAPMLLHVVVGPNTLVTAYAGGGQPGPTYSYYCEYTVTGELQTQ